MNPAEFDAWFNAIGKAVMITLVLAFFTAMAWKFVKDVLSD